jgi:hypothetical protein
MNHTRRSKIIFILSLAMLFVMVSAVPASAQAQRLSFSGTTCTQSQTQPEKFWISDDGVMHSRGSVLTNIDMTDGDYDTGMAIMTGNVDLDLVTGYGHAHGTFILYPAAYNGTFEGSWSSHLSPDGLRGVAVGHGTGELEGVQIFNNMSSDNPNDPCTNSSITVLIP